MAKWKLSGVNSAKYECSLYKSCETGRIREQSAAIIYRLELVEVRTHCSPGCPTRYSCNSQRTPKIYMTLFVWIDPRCPVYIACVLVAAARTCHISLLYNHCLYINKHSHTHTFTYKYFQHEYSCFGVFSINCNHTYLNIQRKVITVC